MIGQRMGRYRVLEKIGKGGMGEVYLARDTFLGRKVALKFLAADLKEDELAHRRFIREAKSAAALDHPFICNVHEVGQTNDSQHFIVMEFVPGESLNKILARGPLPLLESLQILRETAEALEEAHSKGIVHRDLKPSNIMVTTGGHAKVMDFGLAKRTEHSGDQEITSVLTEKGKVLGTPAYMSPEQLQGQEFDKRTDIFSLGVIALQMLTGVHPFYRASTAATVSAILREPPRELANQSLPAEFRQILSRMLEKDPSARYAECSEILGDLQEVVSVLSYPTSPTPPYRKPWWRIHWKKVLFIPVAAVLILGVIFYKSILDKLQLAPLPDNMTVAVLPFTVMNQESETVAFAEGLNERVTRTLCRLGPTYPFNLVPGSLVKKREVLSPDLMAQRLGANLGLVGSFQRNADIVELKLQLVEGDSNRRLRLASVSGPYAEPPALESTLVEKVVEMLGFSVSPSDRHNVYNVGFQNPRAYHFYLRGLGFQNGSTRDLDSAIEAFETALSWETNSAPAEACLGLSLLEKYRKQPEPDLLNEVLSRCTTARNMDENSFEANLCLGEVALELNQEDEALTRFESAYAVEPNDDVILNRLELMYTRLNRRGRIEDLYQAAVARQPLFWKNYSRLGAFYFESFRLEEAIDQFNRVVELAPQYGPAFNALGAIYASLSCWDRALAMFQKARKWDSREIVDTNVATAYFFAGRYVEALKEAESAIVYLEKGAYPEEDFKDHGNLGDIHYWSPGGFPQKAHKCYEKAITLAQEYLEQHPGDPETLSYLALYHAMISERNPALEYLDRALQPAQEQPKNLYRAALIHRVLGNTRRSLHFVERYFESGGSPRDLAQDPAFEEIRKQPEYRELASHYPDLGGCPDN